MTGSAWGDREALGSRNQDRAGDSLSLSRKAFLKSLGDDGRGAIGVIAPAVIGKPAEPRGGLLNMCQAGHTATLVVGTKKRFA